MTDVTQILSEIEHGDPAAAERLLPLVYDELRKLADLHQEGHLNDQEFANAKRCLITENRSEPPTQPKTSATVRFAETSYRSSRWSSGNFFFSDV